MNKKLLLIALLCSAPIMAKAPDLAGTDTDGCSDSEDTLYTFWQELRNANKRSNVPVTTPEQQAPVITQPEESKPEQFETPKKVHKNKRRAALLQEELQGVAARLAEIKLSHATTQYKIWSLSCKKSDAQSALQSPKTRGLITFGAGTLGAVIAGTIVDNRFGVNSGPHAFALLEVATITAAIKMYRNAEANNENCMQIIASLQGSSEKLESESTNLMEQITELEQEIARLEQELKEQQA